MIHLTRRYRFSASHRLHQDSLSEEENRRLYGKCDNPYGHGHNYALEVTLAGEIEPETGMLFDPALLDRTVEREVIEPFDHTYLNLDVERFRALVPTTENLCVEIFRALEGKISGAGRWPSARLERVRLEETGSNFFECGAGRETHTFKGRMA